MGIPPFIEGCLGSLFSNAKGRDAKLFIKERAFSSFPEPTFVVESPDCGPSGSAMGEDYSQLGSERFPLLKWNTDSLAPEIKEYLIIVEDPDAPLPTPITHGLYWGITGETTGFGGEAVKPNGDVKGGKGYRVGKNRKGTVYLGPRPVLGHGEHRYMFDVIGLKEKLDAKNLNEIPTKEDLSKAIDGKVVGWGRWMGTFERKWK
jgi:phosphatidylethanolamine-binding protein (PEBP) family uncharacterized protein